MHARVGDRIIVRGTRVGDPDRDGEVVEVVGADGGPPYRVRWGDADHEALFYPGPDAEIHHVDTADG